MPSPVFQAIVTTLDRSSPALATIKRNIEGLSGAAMRAQVSTQRLALVPLGRLHGAVTGLGGAFASLRGHIGGAFSALTSLMPPLAALGAGASLAGVFGMVRHVADTREEMLHMAETIGITAPQLARLNFIARQTGTNVEGMQTGMTKLNRVMGDAARGKNKSALELFKRMGVTMEELRSGNAATILPKIAASFRATESDTLKAAMAVALFGRAGQSMKVMLQQTPEQLRAWIAELGRLGYAFTKVDDDNLTKFRQTWIGLETAVGGFTNMLGAKLAPVLEPIVAQFRDWIAANRPWITGEITEAVGRFVTWLQQLNWKSIGEQMRSFMHDAGELFDKLGGVKGMLIGIAAITFAPVIASFAQLAATILTFAPPAWLLFLMRGAPLALPLALSGDTANNEQTRDAEKAARDGRQDEWLKDNPNLSTRLWKWLTTPPAGTPAPGAPGAASPGTPPAGMPAPGALSAPAGIPFGPQLVPLPGQRPTGTIPTLKILPDLSGWPVALPDARPSGVMPQADRGAALPNLYAPTGAPGLPGQQGAVDVNVRFANAPPGIEVDTQSTGSVRVPRPEVGYAFGFERLGFA
ncbi:MAG: hypothetical protein WDN25_30115 [Acetobacteraceae bacterium]